MPVAPDLLLQTTPDVKSKSAAKTPSRPAQSGRDESSSFANVYARERQAKPAERNEGPAKPAADKGKDVKRKDSTADDSSQAQPAVADSGKPLPTDPATPSGSGDAVVATEEGTPTPTEPTLDPLLMMAMSGQTPPPAPPVVADSSAVDDVPEPALDPAVSLPAAVTPGVLGSATGMTEASHDPTQDDLNSALTVKLTLEQGVQAQPTPGANVQSAASAASAQPGSQTQADFSAAMANLMGQSTQATEEASLESEPGLGELKSDAADGSASSTPTDLRSESFANRLSALSQAIGQQNATVQKALPLVPGQAVSMQQGNWSEAVVDRVMWLSSQNLKSAEIQLDPAELGRLEVRVNLAQDQSAQVTFVSPNANVRDALEGQVHRLRELFSQQGMNQLDVSVSDQSLSRNWQGQQQSGGDGGRRGGRGDDGGSGAGDDLSVSVSEIRHNPATGARSLVDYYA